MDCRACPWQGRARIGNFRCTFSSVFFLKSSNSFRRWASLTHSSLGQRHVSTASARGCLYGCELPGYPSYPAARVAAAQVTRLPELLALSGWTNTLFIWNRVTRLPELPDCPSYPTARVTRLVGLDKHSVYMKPSYPAARVTRLPKLHGCPSYSPCQVEQTLCLYETDLPGFTSFCCPVTRFAWLNKHSVYMKLT